MFSQKRVISLLQRFSTPSRTTNVVLSVLVIVLIVSYLWQINVSTQSGLELQALEQEYALLLEENKDKQIAVAQLQSISQLQNRLAHLPLQDVDSLEYVQLTGVSAVAVK